MTESKAPRFMDSGAYKAALKELRALRDEIRPLEAKLVKLTAARERLVGTLGLYEKAKAERIAPAAGLSVTDVVDLVPRLGPRQQPSAQPVPADAEAQAGAATSAPAPGPAGALAPALTRVSEQSTASAETASAEERTADESAVHASDVDAGEPSLLEEAPAGEGGPLVPARADAAPVAGGSSGVVARELPSIPVGQDGDAWCATTDGLVSKRPSFTQQARQMAFLDANTGVLVYRDHQARLSLGDGSAAAILAAVYATVPESVERIYITAGDPWHRDAERYGFLRDAVAAWLNAPVPGWSRESSRGRDRMAGHLVHERNPVGRWQRGGQHTEIRSVGEWFDPDGADPATVRDAFVLLWKELHRFWPDVTVMGSPSQTGRDLWSRTIPAKAGAAWSDGFPVLSEELRGLLHATAGQGRTELIVPPRVPEQLPRLVEYDRTFAYAKHTWASPVGVPRRITAQVFEAMSDKEKTNALFAPSHWQVRVRVPDHWEHVGLLPAPAVGDRAWYYPAEPGQMFTTWAGGAEVNLALRNHLRPWQIEILDGLVWQSGTPLKEWSNRLKQAWSSLRAVSAVHGEEQQRVAAHLASRAVRSILLYGIGAFAQRPRTTTSTVAVGREREIPPGAQIIGSDGETITFQRTSGFSRDPYAHPEWAAGVWSGARAALLSTRMREDGVNVGALHLPAGSIVAMRTDAIYTTHDAAWPYHGRPGDYLKKGHLPYPFSAPRSEQELLSMQALGRVALAEQESA